MREKRRAFEFHIIALLEDGDNPGTGSSSCPGLIKFLKSSSHLGVLRRRGQRGQIVTCGSCL